MSHNYIVPSRLADKSNLLMPKEPRTLTLTLGAASLTHLGGIYLLHRFLTRIGFKAAVAK